MTDEDLKAFFEALQRENAGMREENAAAHAETRRHFDAAVTETRRHFDVVTEATRKDVQIVAESVALLSDKLERTATSLD